jgi:hypothetical protein
MTRTRVPKKQTDCLIVADLNLVLSSRPTITTSAPPVPISAKKGRRRGLRGHLIYIKYTTASVMTDHTTQSLQYEAIGKTASKKKIKSCSFSHSRLQFSFWPPLPP